MTLCSPDSPLPPPPPPPQFTDTSSSYSTNAYIQEPQTYEPTFIGEGTADEKKAVEDHQRKIAKVIQENVKKLE